MFGFLGFSEYGGYGYDDGLDRRNWRDKSDAALRREQNAKLLFDNFLERSKASTSFPITEEVVPASVHLTEACWKTFKQYVMDKGCTARRRLATPEERRKSGDKRQGKLYVTSVTIPVHPDQAQQVARQLQEKKEAQAVAKKQKAASAAEKKRIAAERKAAEERELQQKVKDEYAALVASVSTTTPTTRTAALGEHNPATANASCSSPAKKLKTSHAGVTATVITVPRTRILQYAELMHGNRLSEISSQIRREKEQARDKILAELDETMWAKQLALNKAARDECDHIKRSIETALGSGGGEAEPSK